MILATVKQRLWTLAEEFCLVEDICEVIECHGAAHFGWCERNDSGKYTIAVRLSYARAPTRKLSDRQVMDTVCHELAHVHEFSHSKVFKDALREIRGAARRRGWL